MTSAKSVVFSSEHASKVGDLKQEDPPCAETHRVWEIAAGELVFNPGETFSAMTTQRQGLIYNKKLGGKAETTLAGME